MSNFNSALSFIILKKLANRTASLLYNMEMIYVKQDVVPIKKYDPNIISSSYLYPKSMGIDPAYGSSAFGIVVTQWVDNHKQILHAEEYHRPDYNEMLYLVCGLISKYQVDKIYIDGANPSFIKSLKIWIGEKRNMINCQVQVSEVRRCH